MSVSAFNHSVASSSDNAAFAGAKPNTEQSRLSSNARPTVGVSFSSSLDHCGCGPVFGGPPPRPLPIGVRPNPGPPPRPNPALPDPHYAKQSNEQLAQALLDNYEAFKGRWSSGSVTPQSLQKMADRPLTGDPSIDANIQLAKELLRRPALMQALDRNDRSGALDGRLSKNDIRSVVRSDNPLKLHDDKQLVQEMLKHFDALKGNCFSRTIKLKDLRTLASQPLTGNPFNDHLIQLSREIMARSVLTSLMDNKSWWQRDGKISRHELRALFLQP